MIRIIILLLSFLIGAGIEHSARANFCSRDCPSKSSFDGSCPGGAAVALKNWQASDKNYCASSIDQHLGLGNVAIGWGKNCATYSGGGTSVSDTSCLAAGSVVGEILDTVSTVGIGILMRQNFCSFSPGDVKLEGAFINKKVLDPCQDSQYTLKEKSECIQCIFEGKRFDGKQCATSNCSTIRDENTKTQCMTCNFMGGVFDSGVCHKDRSPLSNADNKDDESNYIEIAELCEKGLPNLDRPLLDSSGRQVFTDENIPVFCPLTRCNIPTNDIKVKYFDDVRYRLATALPFLAVSWAATWWDPTGFTQLAFLAALTLPQNCCDINILKEGDNSSVGIWGIIKLRGRIEADQICAQMLFGITGWSTLACKPRVAPKINFAKQPCFIENSSCGSGKSHSKWFLPITSRVMECTTDVFKALFESTGCVNGLLTFQENMQGVVRLLLILYIIIFGIQIAFGKSISKREFFSFVLKFALVVFFAVGNLYKGGVSADKNKNGLLFLRDVVNSGMVSFSEMVMSASSGITGETGDGLCDFSNVKYEDNQDGKYNYLKVWDGLDCRLGFYLGLASPTEEGLKMVNGGGATMKIGRGILNMFWGLLFAWRLPIIIFLLLFTIFLLSMVVHLVHLYILAMIAVSILIFFGPLFIPLTLFEKTKEFCDQWVKLLIGYALQPVIVLAIISFMLVTFDKILFTNCSFESGTLANGVPYWVMKEPASETCQKSLGYMVQFFSDRVLKRVSADTVPHGEGEEADAGGKALFYYNTVVDDVAAGVASTTAIVSNFTYMLEGLMLGTFFAFLFYFFAGQMAGLAAELSGGPSLQDFAVGATAVMDAAVNAATKGQFSKAKAAAGADSGSKASRGGADSGSMATTGGGGSGSSASATSAAGAGVAKPAPK